MLPGPILEALTRGWTVVTANQRSARTLHREFDRDRQASGEAGWQPPAIFAWETWLGLLWRTLVLNGAASSLLLNGSQEHALWREVLRADATLAAGFALRPLDSLAELAADAWTLTHAYRARGRLASAADTQDTRAFARWAAEFERLTSVRGYISRARLTQTLTEALQAGKLRLPPQIEGGEAGLLLIGFDIFTPAQQAFLGALRDARVSVEDLSTPPALDPTPQTSATASTHAVVSAPGEHEELAACARWLRTQLTANPEALIAVVVPSPAETRAEIDRTFRRTLSPELEDILSPPRTEPYEFSLGIPLAATAVASSALDILNWASNPLPLAQVTALLLSPNFAGGSEYLDRAEFDAFELRKASLLQPELSIGSLIALASRRRWPSRMPELLRHLAALQREIRAAALGSARSHADWGETFAQLLDAAGWTRAGDSGSTEFQARRRWGSALDELASLDFDGARVCLAEALASLHRIALRTLFAPESREAPVQIVGPLEAAGSRFDAIWFLRAGDLGWPARKSPNPLLAWRLQHELGMPGADPAKDMDLARRITRRIAVSASRVLFSFSEEAAQEHQRASPLVAEMNLPILALDDIAPPEPVSARITLERIADEAEIPAPPDRVFEGGAAILKSQAACGFRAFAEKRLYSSALEGAALGLDPAERGVLVHAALEAFWSEVETQQELRLMTTEERDALLTRSVDFALERTMAHAAPGWTLAYLLAERQRLLKLLRPWLDFELERPAFAVQTLEHRLDDVAIGPLRLKLRVDRVDSVLVDGAPAGGILLDYKTGLVKPADWLGDRPDDPQVPLYAVVSGIRPLAAVGVASIRPGKGMNITGYQASDNTLPKGSRMKAESFAAQVQAWDEVLTRLATEFFAGEARVSPKQFPGTCRNCDQRLLCRLEPGTLEPETLEELGDPAADAEAEFA